MTKMYVVKRSGKSVEVSFDKVTQRVSKLCFDLDTEYVDPHVVTQNVARGIVKGMATQEIDHLASEEASHLAFIHHDYNLLAGRIAASNLQKTIGKSFSEVIDFMYHSEGSPISEELYAVVMANREIIDSAICPELDLTYDIFAFKTLCKSYLLRINGQIMETPQYMNMRVALGVWSQKHLEDALRMYKRIATKMYTPASPTLFNAGTKCPQLASCFLMALKEDSLVGIMDTLKDAALISKHAGGIGAHFHQIRCSGSVIHGTNGKSNGLVPFLQMFNNMTRAVNQAGRRKGAMAVYLEPHHGDFYDFMQLRRNNGSEEFRTRDLFIACWLSDLFMERVKNQEQWTFFNPDVAAGLDEVYGDEYKVLYERYESEGLGVVKVMPAQTLWVELMRTIKETGGPYLTNKDAVNRKSNQKNVGVIKSSNLCNEIVEYSSADETAVCTLSSIILPSFVDEEKSTFNFELLTQVTREVVRNLNRSIDIMWYPVESARKSNMRHRPLGIGVSGLHDTFMSLGMAYDDPAAVQLNKKIFETIYRAAVIESIELAKVDGPYSSFIGSPASKGLFQFDMWDNVHLHYDDWEDIRKDMMMYGLRNSLLTALMPTASSSNIAGVSESFEPRTSNIYTRKVIAGEYIQTNKYMIRDLIKCGVWNEALANFISSQNGSIQNIESIPEDIRRRYRTVWEYKMRDYINMSADRAPFICQTQSLNLYMQDVTIPKLTSMFFHAHGKGLKTMLYYLRTKAQSEAVKFTAVPKLQIATQSVNVESVSDSDSESEGECLSCSA